MAMATHLNLKHIVVDIAPGGNPEVQKVELVQLALENHCDVHAERNGQPFYEINYRRLIDEGVPEL